MTRAGLLVLTLALAGCDAQFTIRGTLTSTVGRPLAGCWLAYEAYGKQHVWTLTVPRFDLGFAVDRVPATVAIGCDGQTPSVLEVPSGGAVGAVVLAPRQS